MTLDAMEPDPMFDESAYEDVVGTFAALRDELTVRVWGADWCGDCRSVLPGFAAAMEAAGVPDDALHVYAVDREKHGELVEAYGVEFVPTVVVERDGEEAARFVESEPVPAAAYLAERLAEGEASA